MRHKDPIHYMRIPKYANGHTAIARRWLQCESTAINKGVQARVVRTVKPELAVVHAIAAHLVAHVLYPDAWHDGHVLYAHGHRSMRCSDCFN